MPMRFLLLLMQLFSCPFAALKPSLSSVHHKYKIRPFDPVTDQVALVEMCRHVYGGTDDLPQKALRYSKDPTCQFFALVNDHNIPTAVANLRHFDDYNNNQQWWLEGVRVSEEQRNNGLAFQLLSAMIDSTTKPKKVLSCTIPSNYSMRRVFDKLGMKAISTFYMLDDWRDFQLSNQTQTHTKKQDWRLVKTESELRNVVRSMSEQQNHECHHLYGIWELLSFQDKPIKEALNHGRVLSSDSTVFALIKLPSDKSNQWLLSITSITEYGVEAAIEEAMILLNFQKEKEIECRLSFALSAEEMSFSNVNSSNLKLRQAMVYAS